MLGKLFVSLQYLLPHHVLTKVMYRLTRSEKNWWKNNFIKHFIKLYNIDMRDYGSKLPHDFRNFNEFFTRPLSEGSRSIETRLDKLASPVDGTLSQSGKIIEGDIIQAKDQSYTALQLLGTQEWAENYQSGSFCTIYLAPYNYHRIHMPCSGRLRRMRYIPGKLFSVNLTTADHVNALFAKNERVICEFDTDYGKLTMVLVGALFVGSMETIWAGEITPNSLTTGFDQDYSDQNIQLSRGQEMGRFNMGSTVIILAEDGNITFQTLQEPVTLGQEIAHITE